MQTNGKGRSSIQPSSRSIGHGTVPGSLLPAVDSDSAGGAATAGCAFAHLAAAGRPLADMLRPLVFNRRVTSEASQMNRQLLVSACALLCALASPAFAADSTGSRVQAPVDGEVTVRATRKLAEIRKEIRAAQDRFIARYNELNTVREYAIACSEEAPTGSGFSRYACRPQYVNTATADEASEWVLGHFSIPSGTVTASKREGFRQNMLAVSSKSPELQKLAQDQVNLQARYDKLLRNTVGAAARPGMLIEESCSVLAAKAGEKPSLQAIPGFSVLSLHPDRPLPVTAADGATISGIVCWRSDMRLAENDYLVLKAGFPLFIKETFDDEYLNRTLALVREGSAFRAKVVSGPELSADEERDNRQMIARYNTE